MNVSNPSNLLIKIPVEKSKNQSALNSNIESKLARPKLLTLAKTTSNNEPNNIMIQF